MARSNSKSSSGSSKKTLHDSAASSPEVTSRAISVNATTMMGAASAAIGTNGAGTTASLGSTKHARVSSSTNDLGGRQQAQRQHRRSVGHHHHHQSHHHHHHHHDNNNGPTAASMSEISDDSSLNSVELDANGEFSERVHVRPMQMMTESFSPCSFREPRNRTSVH